MSESKPDSGSAWRDPDDAPEFTDAMFDNAEFAIGGRVVRAGRKRSAVAVELARYRVMPKAVEGGVHAMTGGKKTTSPKAAKSASKVLKDGRTGTHSKTAAGSALSQREKPKKKK
jgi:hypothetical protein